MEAEKSMNRIKQKRGFIRQMFAMTLAVTILVSIIPVTAHAGERFYDANNLCSMKKADIQTIAKSAYTATPVLRNNKVWYKFSGGGNSVYIESSALYSAKNSTNENTASNKIKNGLQGGTVSYSYTRMVQEKQDNGSVKTYFYYITVSSSTAGSRHTIMVDLDAQAGIQAKSKWNIENKKVLGQKVCLTNMSQYTFNNVKDDLQGLVVKTGIKSIVPTVEVSSNSNKTYRLPNKKYAHTGNFSSVYYKAKGSTSNGRASLKDFLTVAIETATTASSLAKNVSTGNLIGLSSLGLSTIRKLQPNGNSTFETKEQYLSNTDKNKMCYKAKFKSPVRMGLVGDYVQMIFYTNKTPTSYSAKLKLSFQ